MFPFLRKGLQTGKCVSGRSTNYKAVFQNKPGDADSDVKAESRLVIVHCEHESELCFVQKSPDQPNTNDKVFFVEVVTPVLCETRSSNLAAICLKTLLIN